MITDEMNELWDYMVECGIATSKEIGLATAHLNRLRKMKKARNTTLPTFQNMARAWSITQAPTLCRCFFMGASSALETTRSFYYTIVAPVCQAKLQKCYKNKFS